MFDVIVVEDKKITREGLMRLVDWQSIGGYAAASFSGANAAMEYMDHHHVDLVVTDIAMPDGTGLDLLRYVYHNRPDCKVIIISAYEDFSYAHQALSMGACAYLLKPVDSAALLAEAHRAFDEIRARRQVHAQQSFLQWGRLADEICRGLADGTLSQLAPRLQEVRDSFVPEKAVFLYFRTYAQTPASCQRLREIAIETGQPVFLFSHEQELCCVLSGALPASDAVLQILIGQWGLPAPFRMGISEPAPGLSAWPEAFFQARAAFAAGFWNDDAPGVCRFSALGVPAARPAPVHLDYAEMKKFLYGEDMASACARVEEAIGLCRARNADVFPTEMDFYSTVCRLYASDSAPLTDGEADELQRALTECAGCGALRGAMRQALERCFRLSAEKKSQVVRPIVKLAKEYAVKHVSEPELNLKSIAQRLGVSYVYLSKAFKEDFQKGFNEYMAQYRIELAKDYLLEPQAHVYEVCAKVGLEPKNFHGLFKRYTGMTPKTYQARNVHYEETDSGTAGE